MTQRSRRGTQRSALAAHGTAALALLAIAAGIVAPAPAAEPRTPGEAEYEMVTFQFVMLHRGEKSGSYPEAEAEIIQREHLAYLEGLYRAGRIMIFGPLKDGGDLRGIIVTSFESVQEAGEVLARDPWVRAGGLKPEIHPWWAAKGILGTGKEILDHETCYLGLLMRPKDAPDLPKEKLAELQKGHMGNIQRMADAGDLVLAGPMDDDTALRGILIFRDLGRSGIEEMVSHDPSVAARRLEMILYEWSVPKGTLPPRT